MTVRAAFVYRTDIDDPHCWAQTFEEGRIRLQERLGDVVRTTAHERVGEDEAGRDLLARLADDGADIVFLGSKGYQPFVLEIAADFPDTRFDICQGMRLAPNVSSFREAVEEIAYVSGILAGGMTRSGLIGVPVATGHEVVYLNAFALGIRAANPEARIHTRTVGSWMAPEREAAAVHELADLGCDVIGGALTENDTVVLTAAARSCYTTVRNSDRRHLAPDHVLVGNLVDWTPHYVATVEAVAAGTWRPSWRYYHAGDGVVFNTEPADFVPEALALQARRAAEAIRAGRLDLWRGPIRNNRGEEVVPEGRTLADVLTEVEPLPGLTAVETYLPTDAHDWLLDSYLGAPFHRPPRLDMRIKTG
ncbi:BMP family ABC transporter substrate-binding protein [Rhizohabitans arisaemae]|uniref:BMP family ABC transporter substrate-binding protein n=1 Tax=Rhizohabitans arisaemae TaxID=2720610 RepID=UPI0024B23E33|nr:BMP family ABC transporter substrate-binding protein [Rhizohabitans arisaemae]